VIEDAARHTISRHFDSEIAALGVPPKDDMSQTLTREL
jgi:hypothetical protein